ncbi:MAG: peptide ABC transporter substrate-binding protein [bacterium]|nr:peptide ABC transporter substrate-binding protein [bacterium]
MSNEQHGPFGSITIATSAALIALGAYALLTMQCGGCGGHDTQNDATAIAPESTATTIATPQTGLYGSTKRTVTDDAFHYPLGGQPKSCDPHKIETIIEFGITVNECEGLLAWGPKGPTDVRTGVAYAHDVSPNGKTHTFHLRDTKWSNGDPLNADDFVWSWSRAKNPATGQYSFLFNEAKIATFSAPDPHTFVVTLLEPNSIFLNIVPFQTLCPVHRATVEKFGDAWCQPEHFVGNGPYVPVEAKLDDRIVLKKNANYWDAEHVEVEMVVAHAWTDNQVGIDCYKKGECDWTGVSVNIPPAELDAIRDPHDRSRFTIRDVVRYARNASSYIALNTKRKGLDDVRVRHALSLAIDREQLERFVTRSGDVPSTNFIPDGLAGYAPRRDPVQVDCPNAQALFAEAGYPSGRGFPTYEFLYRTNTAVEQNVANAIANMWKDCLEISVTVSGMPMKLWRSKVLECDPKPDGPRTYDITMEGWQGDYPHPHTFAALLQCGNAQNNSDFCDSTYDAAIADGLVAHNPAIMQVAYRRAEDVLADAMPVIPLWFSPRIHAVRPEWTGIEPNAAMNHPLKYVRRMSR